MKRDMDYVRELLLAIEDAPTPIEQSEQLLEKAEAENDEKLRRLNYHLELLIDEAHFVTAIAGHSFDAQQWYDLKLTWNGHEFLETIRDPEVWKLTKEGATKAGNFGIGLMIELAKAYGKHVVKERLGLDLS